MLKIYFKKLRIIFKKSISPIFVTGKTAISLRMKKNRKEKNYQ